MFSSSNGCYSASAKRVPSKADRSSPCHWPWPHPHAWFEFELSAWQWHLHLCAHGPTILTNQVHKRRLQEISQKTRPKAFLNFTPTHLCFPPPSPKLEKTLKAHNWCQWLMGGSTVCENVTPTSTPNKNFWIKPWPVTHWVAAMVASGSPAVPEDVKPCPHWTCESHNRF